MAVSFLGLDVVGWIRICFSWFVRMKGWARQKHSFAIGGTVKKGI